MGGWVDGWQAKADVLAALYWLRERDELCPDYLINPGYLIEPSGRNKGVEQAGEAKAIFCPVRC